MGRRIAPTLWGEGIAKLVRAAALTAKYSRHISSDGLLVCLSTTTPSFWATFHVASATTTPASKEANAQNSKVGTSTDNDTLCDMSKTKKNTVNPIP